MKANTERSLKGVSTLKLGAEYKPVPEVAFRVGYNYITSGYKMDGVRDMTVDSPGTMYASTTDYAFQDYQSLASSTSVSTGVTKVSNKRSQGLLTIGYTF